MQALKSVVDDVNFDDIASVERLFAASTTDDWLAKLVSAGVPAANAVVDAVRFLYDSAEFRASGSRIDVPTERYGMLGQAGPAVRFSRTPVRVERQEPGLGAHTEEVLHEVGMGDAAIAQLRASGTIPAKSEGAMAAV